MRLTCLPLALALLTAAAACAPVAAPPPVGEIATAPAGVYDALRAPVHARLQLCDGTTAFNAGPIGWDGAVADFTSYLDTPAGPVLRNPTDSACLSSGYGYRPQANGGDSEHLGLDLANRHGGFIYAAAPGRVINVGWRGTYGLMVEIDHGEGVVTRYGHLSEVSPRMIPGANVPPGAAIGRMGRTGNASGIHLHYEILIGGQHVNPLAAPPAGS